MKLNYTAPTFDQVTHEISKIVGGLLLALTHEYYMIEVLSDGVQQLVSSVHLKNNKAQINNQQFIIEWIRNDC